MSGLPPAEMREKVRRVLESMRGVYNVWNLDITGIRKKDGDFVIVGSFTDGLLSVVTKNFEITIDKDGNVVGATMSK